MERIRPSADLRNHYAEISRLCRESRQPVYITVNGHGDTVLIGLAEYEQMRIELELLRMLAEAEEDVRAPRRARGRYVPRASRGTAGESGRMKYEIYRTDKANDQLHAIIHYIAADSGSASCAPVSREVGEGDPQPGDIPAYGRDSPICDS
jgi:prevent-host-death family protein